MGRHTGFKEFEREVEPYRDPESRVLDFEELYTPHDVTHLRISPPGAWIVASPFASQKMDVPSII